MTNPALPPPHARVRRGGTAQAKRPKGLPQRVVGMGV